MDKFVSELAKHGMSIEQMSKGRNPLDTIDTFAQEVLEATDPEEAFKLLMFWASIRIQDPQTFMETMNVPLRYKGIVKKHFEHIVIRYGRWERGILALGPASGELAIKQVFKDEFVQNEKEILRKDRENALRTAFSGQTAQEIWVNRKTKLFLDLCQEEKIKPGFKELTEQLEHIFKEMYLQTV